VLPESPSLASIEPEDKDTVTVQDELTTWTSPTTSGAHNSSPDRFAVLRQAATEAPFSGSLLNLDANGVSPVADAQRLFTSAQKFDSGCGWPSFDACEPGTIVGTLGSIAAA